jgi:hypothetical protein
MTAGFHRGQADGTFTAATRSGTYTMAVTPPGVTYSFLSTYVFGDFNRDGRMDFAVAGT